MACLIHSINLGLFESSTEARIQKKMKKKKQRIHVIHTPTPGILLNVFAFQKDVCENYNKNYARKCNENTPREGVPELTICWLNFAKVCSASHLFGVQKLLLSQQRLITRIKDKHLFTAWMFIVHSNRKWCCVLNIGNMYYMVPQVASICMFLTLKHNGKLHVCTGVHLFARARHSWPTNQTDQVEFGDRAQRDILLNKNPQVFSWV